MTETSNHYNQICETLQIQAIPTSNPLLDFLSPTLMADKSREERLSASLQVLLDCVLEESNTETSISHTRVDAYIAKIDILIQSQLDQILHHPEFQALESRWRGLHYLMKSLDLTANTKLEVLDISQTDLQNNFTAAETPDKSFLYKQLYTQEYDMPGGEPISVMIGDYTFESSAQDIQLLRNISSISAAAHCPFIASVGPPFFGKKNFDEVSRIEDLENYMDRAEFIRWRSFRDTEDSRYIGLTLPKFILRHVYGSENPATGFIYEESIHQCPGDTGYLWGNASLAFAANMARSFKSYGWMLNVRGSDSGGRVENLPLHQFDTGFGLQTNIPTQVLIPETRELSLASQGLIPLSYYKNTDYACFFSANACHKPPLYSTPEATANSRINARLPYLFLSTRIGHYLKVIQRENIGSAKSPHTLEDELNTWLRTLVTKMNNPSQELLATHPLKEGYVAVHEIEDNPGFYRVELYAVPHFQVEGVDIKLSLVGQMPRENKDQ
jgi:type VI secretion system protein ImpC